MSIVIRSTTRASVIELAAHAAVTYGWPVLPLFEREKKPRTSHGYKDATLSHERVTEFWRRWPCANLGIATGSASGIFVLDVDGGGGEAALSRICDIPRTVEVRTAKGRHLYFRMPTGISLGLTVSRLAAELDTRADGGYIVAPPSLHPSGHTYAWVTGCSPECIELAEIPRELLFQLLPKMPMARAPARCAGPRKIWGAGGNLRELGGFLRWMRENASGVGTGQRNNRAFSVACYALKVMSRADAETCLDLWNSGLSSPLDVREIASVFRSATRTLRGAPV